MEAVLPDQAMSEIQAVSNWVESLSSLELRRVQTDDPNIGIVIGWLEHSYAPTIRKLHLTGPETRVLWLTRDHLTLQCGISYYSWANLKCRSECLVVPMELRPRVLYYCHDSKGSGHLGQTKTLDR